MSCFYIVNSIDERSIKIDVVCSQLDSQETETCFHGGRCPSVFHTINTRLVIYHTGCLRGCQPGPLKIVLFISYYWFQREFVYAFDIFLYFYFP